jgi:pimeloyl-ACP methyl ester carboxylesterase
MIAAPKLEKVTSNDGTQLACWVSGEGPPLLMIHGTTADHTSWRFVLPALQEHFTVYAVDRRGRGDSRDSDVYTIGLEYEDVAALVDSIGKPVNVLGHSFGATLAVEAALRTKDLRRLVLYEPALGQSTDEFPGIIDRLERLIERGEREAALEIVLTEIAGMSLAAIEQVRSSPVWPLRLAAVHTVPRELQAARDYTFRPERFGGLRIPTLLLLGNESPSYATESTAAIAAALPDARLIRMPGQGHVAMLTAPELFANEVISFLDV